MPVKLIEFKNFNISAGFDKQFRQPTIRKEFVEDPLLNIYHPIKGNPVIEN